MKNAIKFTKLEVAITVAIVSLLIASGVSIVSAAYALRIVRKVDAVANEWVILADEVKHADIRVCADALPPGLHNASIKEIPEPDPEPCGEQTEGWIKGVKIIAPSPSGSRVSRIFR